MAVARLASTSLDCSEPAALADFWAALLGGEVPKQIHLDLATSNLEAAEAEALRLGARKADDQPAPDRWRVLFDPAGHPFCFTTQIPE